MDYSGHYNTCNILNCLSLVTALCIASCSDGRCFEPRHELSQYFITYNCKADRRARVCLRGGGVSYLMLIWWVLSFWARSGVATHGFYFPPPVVLKVLCNVVFEFLFLFFSVLVFFCTKTTHQERLKGWGYRRQEAGWSLGKTALFKKKKKKKKTQTSFR